MTQISIDDYVSFKCIFGHEVDLDAWGRFNVLVFHVSPLASKQGWHMSFKTMESLPSIYQWILRLIRPISTHLESALKGNVKRSNESATAFLVQYIWSRTPNI